jgi:hypothetical protein
MRIECHRISEFNSTKQVEMPSGEKRCGPISSVNVEPDVAVAANLMNLEHAVYGPGAGRSRGSYNTKRLSPRFQIPFDCFFKPLGIQL